jgi:hypothetical protein
MTFNKDQGFWILKNGEVFIFPDADEHYNSILNNPEKFGLTQEWKDEMVSYYKERVQRNGQKLWWNFVSEMVNNAIEAGNIRVRTCDMESFKNVMFTIWNLKRDRNRVLDFLFNNANNLKRNKTFTLCIAEDNEINNGFYHNMLDFQNLKEFVDFLAS